MRERPHSFLSMADKFGFLCRHNLDTCCAKGNSNDLSFRAKLGTSGLYDSRHVFFGAAIQLNEQPYNSHRILTLQFEGCFP
jgi:hypothetical protein